MEIAYEQILGQGILGVFLVLVIIYFLKLVKDLKAEMKEKSLAHAISMKEKDLKIEELNDKIHNLGIEAVTSVREWTNTLKDLLK